MTVTGKINLLPYILFSTVCYYELFANNELKVLLLPIYRLQYHSTTGTIKKISPFGICSKNGDTISLFDFLDRFYEGFHRALYKFHALSLLCLFYAFPKYIRSLGATKWNATW